MRTMMLSALLLGCAESPSEGQLPSDFVAPPLGLAVGDVVSGEPLTLTARGANAGDVVYFGVGARPGRPVCPPLLAGGCYDITQPQFLGRAVAGRSGVAELTVTVPPGLPEGLIGWFQAVGVGRTGYASPAVPVAVQAADCTQALDAFRAEAASIMSCRVAADCGTPLPRTSCGCTRSWVARVGVDTTLFYDLLDEATACGLDLTSTCDCPSTSGFDCVQNTCTWNYVP